MPYPGDDIAVDLIGCDSLRLVGSTHATNDATWPKVLRAPHDQEFKMSSTSLVTIGKVRHMESGVSRSK